MPDTKISEAQNKATLEATDMIPLAAANDATAYHIKGENLFSGLPSASTSQKGSVELATAAEAQAGTDTERAVTPAGLLVRKTGTAILAGSLSGDERGEDALDVQAERSTTTQVASGARAVAVGTRNTAGGADASAMGRSNNASGAAAAAVGYGNVASQANAAAVGKSNTASGDSASAVGVGATASALGATALGFGAVARIEKTTNICGAQVIRKDNGEAAADAFYSFCGVMAVLMTKEIDLKVVADYTLTIPTGCHFYPHEVGILISSASGVSGQPTVYAGWTGDQDGFGQQATLGLTSKFLREQICLCDVWTDQYDGKTELTFGVYNAATGTTLKGRFYFIGLLVEDE